MFLPVTAEVCMPLQKLAFVKSDCRWNEMCQDLYDRTKKIVKKDAGMKFYDVFRSLYLETDASGVGHGAKLLQVRDGMNCGNDEVQNNATLPPNAFTS